MSSTRRFTLLFLISTFLVLAFAAGAHASPLAQKKQRLKAVQAQLQSVYQESDMAVEQYNDATARLKLIKQQIAKNTSLLAVARQKLLEAEQQLGVRAQAIYKSNNIGMVDVVFSSGSFDDLVTQVGMMQRIGNHDAAIVGSVISYQNDIKKRQAELNADEATATKLVAQRAEQKNKVLATQRKLENLTAGIKGDIKRIQDQQAAAARAAAERAARRPAASNPGGGGGNPGGGGGNTPAPVDPGGSGRSAVLGIARQYLGVPYVWAGASPSGFDCSGFTMYCYGKLGIGLAHGATMQQKCSRPVPIGSLQPGDLVFFGNASYSSHVGIYVGGGSIIHASSSQGRVCYGSVGNAWIGGRL